MATTSEYLTQLQNDKQTLVDNLVTKGVSATSDETFTSLVPKVLDIQSGGGELEINDASYLFYQGARLNALDTLLNACKNITSCYYMFNSGTIIKELDLSNLDTSICNNMQGMFGGCTYLKNINLSNVDTHLVSTMAAMFANCKSLQKLDISSFTSEKLTNNINMLNGCSNLSTLIINNNKLFKMTNVSMVSNTPIASGTGYVYVPDDMVETYKSATNWSVYADQIKPIGELPAEEA